MTGENQKEKGDTNMCLSGVRYLRVTRGQKERKRKRLERMLNSVVLEIYNLDKEIARLESAGAELKEGGAKDV